MGLLNFSISLFEDEFGLIITGLRVPMILRRSCQFPQFFFAAGFIRFNKSELDFVPITLEYPLLCFIVKMETYDPNNPVHALPPPSVLYPQDPNTINRLAGKDRKTILEEEIAEATDHELFELFKRPPSPRIDPTDDTHFYVMVSGMVEYAQHGETDQMLTRYNFEAGQGWEQIHGMPTGSSHITCKAGGMSKKLIFNFPFEVGFRSSNMQGWPQIVVTIIGTDFMGRDVPYGYGNVHVPTKPGRHVRYVRTFKPHSSSNLVNFISWLKGTPSEYSDPGLTLAQCEGREVTRVTSHGLVKVVFVVALVNMDKFGV